MSCSAWCAWGFGAALSLVAVSAAAQSSSLSLDASLLTPAITGTNIQYQINVSSEGPDDAATVALNFSTDAGSTFVSLAVPAGWICISPSPGQSVTVSCTKVLFSPGTDSFTLIVTTPPGTPIGTVMTLSGSVSSTTPDPDLNDNSIQLQVPLEWQSILSVSKSAPATADAGAQFDTTITIINNGPSFSADVTMDDALPPELLFVSVAAPGWSCITPAVGASGTVSCSNPVIALGPALITVRVSSAPSQPVATVTNNVTVTSSTDPGTRTASASTTFTQHADVSIAKSMLPTAPSAGQPLTYTIVVSNAGPSDATSVVMNDPLPAAFQFQTVTAAGWTCGGTTTINCTLPTLAGGGSSTITIDGTVAASTASGTVISNTATASSATPDPTTPNSATASGTSIRQSDLAVTISDSPDPVISGSNITYQVVVANGGPVDAFNPTLNVTLDPALTFVSATAPAGWTCTTTSCSGALLANAGTAPFTFVAKVNAGTAPGAVLTTSATAGSGSVDPNNANNSASTTTGVLSPAVLSAVKSVVPQSVFFVGGSVTYTVVITNSGAAAQGDNPGAEMTDVLPASLTLVSASATSGTAVATIGTNTVTWNGSVPSAGSVTVTIVATINAGAGFTQISNQATVSFDADGNGTNESSATSNAATFTPSGATQVPAMSDLALMALGAALAAIAVARLAR